MLKKMVFLIPFLLVLAIPTMAQISVEKVIDAQEYVECDIFTCIMTFPANSYLTVSEINSLKSVNLKLHTNELPETIKSLDYRWDKDVIIVTIEIEGGSQNYFIFNYSGVVIDPWANSSYPYRMKADLNSPVASNVNNVLINLTFDTKTPIDAGKMQADCDDIYIADNDTTELNYTLEGCYNTDSQLFVWVPVLYSDNSTDIYVHYGYNNTSSRDHGASICDIGLDAWFMFEQDQSTDFAYTNNTCGSYSLDASNQGDPAIVDSYLHNGTDFDGNDCIRSADPYANLSAFSVEAWLFPDTEVALDVPVIKGDLDVGAGDREWAILESNAGGCSGKLAFGIMSSFCSEAGEVWSCSDDIGTGSWNHYVGVRDTATVETYTNTNAGGTEACTNAGYSKGQLLIGSHDCGSPGTGPWDGKMDNLRIWNKALSSDEISIMYHYFLNNVGVSFGAESELDAVIPTYRPESNLTNGTQVSTNVSFQLEFNDDTALETSGTWIFSTNNTGTWINSSSTSFSATPENATNVTMLNSTSGVVVGWCFYATDNQANMNGTSCVSPFFLTTTSAPATPIVQTGEMELCYRILDNCITYNVTNLSAFSSKNDVFCSDNNTLYESITITDSGNESITFISRHCEYDCDNITYGCLPPEYVQDMIALAYIGLGVFFVIIILVIFKRLRL